MHVTILRSAPNIHWHQYEMSYTKGMTVLDVIMHVQQNLDPTLAFRYECRQGICGTCGVMYNDKPVLSCSTQIVSEPGSHRIAPLSNFPVEADLIVDLAGVLNRFEKVKPYLEKYQNVILTKTMADTSKAFRKCIECGLCIAGSATVRKFGETITDPMALVKIARYLSDPRDHGGERISKEQKKKIQKYSKSEAKYLADICPRGIPIDTAIQLVSK